MGLSHDEIIFLHGPSGAGKGAAAEELISYYTQLGYRVTCVSSGDLYRSAAKKALHDVMAKGNFMDTLGDILEGMKAKYNEYLEAREQNNGKSILIMDGFIRRDQFTREDGSIVESQIDQIARAFKEVDEERADAPGLTIGIEQARIKILTAKHVLVDIDPEDAKDQMKARVNKEVDVIARQTTLKLSESEVGDMLRLRAYMLNASLAQLIYANPENEGDQLHWERKISAQVGELAELIAIDGRSTMSEVLKSLGIKNGIRKDDLSPSSRENRVSGNYVKKEVEDGGATYTLGFAAQALVDGLGYQFDPLTGSFISDRPNLVVLKNGKSRGIGFEGFKAAAREMAAHATETSGYAEGLNQFSRL